MDTSDRKWICMSRILGRTAEGIQAAHNNPRVHNDSANQRSGFSHSMNQSQWARWLAPEAALVKLGLGPR